MATQNTNVVVRKVYQGVGAYDVAVEDMDVELDTIGNMIDIRVELIRGANPVVVLQQGTDYTINGRVINVTNNNLIGDTLVITRQTPSTHEFDFTENEPFPANEFTQALNRLTFMNQTINAANRVALQYPPSDDVNISAVIPPKEVRAGLILGFNQDGEPVAIDTVFQEQVVGLNSEDIGGGNVRITFVFATGGEFSFTVGAVGFPTVPVVNAILTQKVITENVTIPSDKNGFTVGPVSFAGDFEIETGAKFVIIDDET